MRNLWMVCALVATLGWGASEWRARRLTERIAAMPLASPAAPAPATATIAALCADCRSAGARAALDALRGRDRRDDLSHAQQDITGCLDEWAERFPDRDVTLTIALEVTPRGQGHDARAIGAVGSIALRECVADALTRVAYEPAADPRDVEVTVRWVAKTVRLVARRL